MAKDMGKLDDRLRGCASFSSLWLPCTLHHVHDCNGEVFFFLVTGFFSLSAVSLMVALPCRERLQYMVCNNIAAPPRAPQM